MVDAHDFEQVLKTTSLARSLHFSIHHIAAAHVAPAPVRRKLSTGHQLQAEVPVHDVAVAALRLGLVVPKRHARRSVTRTLLKRQIRAALQRQPVLNAGLWLVRLRSPFDRQAFPSAASKALAHAARQELDGLLLRAAGCMENKPRAALRD